MGKICIEGRFKVSYREDMGIYSWEATSLINYKYNYKYKYKPGKKEWVGDGIPNNSKYDCWQIKTV